MSTFTIEDFITNEREQDNLFEHALTYMLYKISVQENKVGKTGKSFKAFLEDSSKPTTKDTIINTLQERLDIGSTCKYMGAIGDGKTYDHLHSLKVEYGEELNWLIPLPGDWHILKNFQEVIMKVYFDGGLRDAAKQAGCSEGILNSIGARGKFKRTNDFILKVWESILRVF